MTPNDLDPVVLQQRYSLLCRALQATPAADDPQPALDTVSRLDELIHRELLELARLGSPDDFAEIYLGFTRELDRFREFCADPRLAEKTVVAFGGPFSAGKSSLINALIGKKLLVVEVDPTTALPAYVLAGQVDAVHALNLHHLRISLTDDELASLTHDETQRYGSQVARALSAAFITRCDFPWANLAFIDTPGYSGRAMAGDRTDADIAATQLAGAHAFVWVASIKQGNLSEEDLAFLARIDPDIPRIVVASHADQVTESDRAAVIERMKETLTARNLPVLGVYAVSARPRQAELLAPLRAQLDTWNQTPRQQRFAHRFKALFTRYQRALEREITAARWQLHRLNRIALLADGDTSRDAAELKSVIDERLTALKSVESRLSELRGRFFCELKRAGDAVGIPLPEPHEVDLLEPGRSNLLEQLVALREKDGREEPNMKLALAILQKKGAANQRQILIRTSGKELPEFQQLPQHTAAIQSEHILQNYALLLASVLTAQLHISETQTRLFCLLLNSLGLGDIRGSLFEQARKLTPDLLVDAADLVCKLGFSYQLLLDALVLLRCEAPLNSEATHLIGELAAFLGIEVSILTRQAEDAAEILGLNARSLRKASPKKPLLAKLWPSSPQLTAQALRDGLMGGIWFLDQDLNIDFPWQACGAILIFRNSAVLNTFAKEGQIKLTDCRFVDATLKFQADPRFLDNEPKFQGACPVILERCEWWGGYDPDRRITALCSYGQSLVVRNSNFSLNQACAIMILDASLTLQGCTFLGCGIAAPSKVFVDEIFENTITLKKELWFPERWNRSEKYIFLNKLKDEKDIALFSGAATVLGDLLIQNCRFERCAGGLGGALFVSDLSHPLFNRDSRSYGINECEFVDCESWLLKEQQAGEIAVYAHSAGGNFPVITQCIFRYASVYVENCYEGLSRIKSILSGCRFLGGNVYITKSESFSRNYICGDSTFEANKNIESGFIVDRDALPVIDSDIIENFKNHIRSRFRWRA